MKQHIESLIARVNLELVFLILIFMLHFLVCLVQPIVYKTLFGIDGLYYIIVMWNTLFFTSIFIILLYRYKTGSNVKRLYLITIEHWCFITVLKWLHRYIFKDLFPLIEVLLYGEWK